MASKLINDNLQLHLSKQVNDAILDYYGQILTNI